LQGAVINHNFFLEIADLVVSSYKRVHSEIPIFAKDSIANRIRRAWDEFQFLETRESGGLLDQADDESKLTGIPPRPLTCFVGGHPLDCLFAVQGVAACRTSIVTKARDGHSSLYIKHKFIKNTNMSSQVLIKPAIPCYSKPCGCPTPTWPGIARSHCNFHPLENRILNFPCVMATCRA
jgi:hypothetical protein